MKLSDCVALFLTRYLCDIRGVSANTIKSYKNTFRVFIPYAAQYLSKRSGRIEVADLSADLIIDFLYHLENDLGNTTRTRNIRLATIRSLAQMILLLDSDDKAVAEQILKIPSKRAPKPVFGFLSHDEARKVFDSVDLKRKEGFRDYTILHLLYDSGARAHEIAGMRVDAFDPEKKNIGILGKGSRFRIVQLWPRTTDLIIQYVKKYRQTPWPLYQHRLFINQRRQGFTRHGIHRICQKYLKKVLPENRLKNLNATHCFRHYGERYKMVSDDRKPAKPTSCSSIHSPFYH